MNKKIHQLLSAVPDGSVKIINASGAVQRQAQTRGKGLILSFQVFAGVTLEYNCFQSDSVHFMHRPLDHVLEINHCHEGRVGWDMKSGSTIYLGAGDLAMQPMDCCADSLMRFPSGCYEGIQITIDLATLDPRVTDTLQQHDISASKLRQRYCSHQVFSIPANAHIESIFAILYHQDPPSAFLHQIKVMELLAYLADLDPHAQKAVSEWNTEQTAIIQQMHDFLIAHPQQRYTIDELSRRFLINTSTLKSAFKAIYGMPIAAYMKEFRMHKAMKLLQDPSLSIAQIAAMLGYESQSKFARAFKEHAGVLPKDYRKEIRERQ